MDLLELSPLSGVGYSCVIPEIGGILRDVYPAAYKSVWYMRGNVYAESRHIPGVRIPALPHPGVIGVAPSHEMLARWNEREAPLAADQRAYPPHAETALFRGVGPAKHASMAAEAARTVPPRENGGNVDIKNLSQRLENISPGIRAGGPALRGRPAFCRRRWRSDLETPSRWMA